MTRPVKVEYWKGQQIIQQEIFLKLTDAVSYLLKERYELIATNCYKKGSPFLLNSGGFRQ